MTLPRFLPRPKTEVIAETLSPMEIHNIIDELSDAIRSRDRAKSARPTGRFARDKQQMDIKYYDDLTQLALRHVCSFPRYEVVASLTERRRVLEESADEYRIATGMEYLYGDTCRKYRDISDQLDQHDRVAAMYAAT